MARLLIIVMLAGAVTVAGLGGCANGARSGLAGNAAAEPTLICIRNATGRNLGTVSVQEAGVASGLPMRLGSVSPLLRGQTHIIERRPDLPPLPDSAEVSWQDPRAGPGREVVDLRPALREAIRRGDRALIFEIMANGSVRILSE